MSAMTTAIWISILVHVVVLSIQFQPELKKFQDKLPILEVFLVNAKTASKPENAEVYAQANLDRGGNTEQDRKLASALPALKQQKTEFSVKPTASLKESAKAAKKVSEEVREQQRVALLEKQAQELMTQIESTHKVEAKPEQSASSKVVESGTNQASKKLDMQDIAAAALEMDRLEALISKQQDEYQNALRKNS